MTLTFSQNFIDRIKALIHKLPRERVVIILSLLLAIGTTVYVFAMNWIVVYGDAESHLNIAKRVVDSLTPGFAQLGGIWLPLPHVLMMPFVYFDPLWRSGLAGSIVSGAAFVAASLYLYKIGFHITGNKWVGFVAAIVFMANPNVLYLQSTPMTEVLLIAFFTLSTYYFIRFIENTKDIQSLVFAALFGFCAALSRYDGWFLVCVELGIIGLLFFPWKRLPRSFKEFIAGFKTEHWHKLQGNALLFGVLAFFAVAIWLTWDWLILGDPLYFTHSEFSARSQQLEWHSRGYLPAYHNIAQSVAYYVVTAMSNVGIVLFALMAIGIGYFIATSQNKHKYYVLLILLVPFIFNVLTLFLGQSIIFIPHITPAHFEWKLFNARYGVMAVPLAAVAIGYLTYKVSARAKAVIAALFVFQLGLYAIGYSKVITLEDGRAGLSSSVAKQPDAQRWLEEHYDDGLVLVDDYARTISIIRSGIPMKNIIYIGNKPYWEDSLEEPEKYATWLVMQQNDAVWKNLIDNKATEGRMYKYFNKVYTSPEILIFKRNPEVPL